MAREKSSIKSKLNVPKPEPIMLESRLNEHITLCPHDSYPLNSFAPPLIFGEKVAIPEQMAFCSRCGYVVLRKPSDEAVRNLHRKVYNPNP